MPAVSPTLLLVLAAALTLAALAVSLGERRLRHARLRRLAQEFNCRFKPVTDPLLGRRLAAHLPAPGAADVRLGDFLLVGRGEQWTLARVDYSLGSVLQRRDHTRIVAFGRDDAGEIHEVRFAPANLPRLEQYRHLLESAAAAPVEPAAPLLATSAAPR